MKNTSVRPTWAELDLAALESNVIEVQRLVGPGRKLIASIKGDAYGHGALKVAEALSRFQIHGLWTGSIDEALQIRSAGIGMKIILFGGYLPESIPEILGHDLTPTIYDIAGAHAVSKAGRAPTAVYIKVDSGLGRLGVPLQEAPEFIERVAALPNIAIEGIYTHLPFPDAAGRDWARIRHAEFEKFLEVLARRGITVPITQSMASSGVLAGLDDKCTAVCVGHLLYGLSPISPAISVAATLRPVLREIKTRLIHVAHHAPGRDIAIGGLYGIKNASVTGVVPLGLCDGMRTIAPGRTAYMLLRGRRVRVMGVALEHVVLDLDEIMSPEVGEEVIVVGESDGERATLGELAGSLGCGELEVVMSFARNLRYEYQNVSDDVWSSFGR